MSKTKFDLKLNSKYFSYSQKAVSLQFKDTLVIFKLCPNSVFQNQGYHNYFEKNVHNLYHLNKGTTAI